MKHSAINLETIADKYRKNACERRIIVCAGTACVANGALKLIDALVKKITIAGLPMRVETADHQKNDIHLSKSGCHGFCQMGPLVTIMPENILYVKVKADDADEIVEKTLKNGEIIDRLLYIDPNSKVKAPGAAEITVYNRQKRTVLAECGHIDPEDIKEYIAHGG